MLFNPKCDHQLKIRFHTLREVAFDLQYVEAVMFAIIYRLLEKGAWHEEKFPSSLI